MSEANPILKESTPAVGERRQIKWDAVAAIIASLIGFLALLVAAYTAYVQRYTADIQREQVRAQVWPYLIPGNSDLTQSLVVNNKGNGPAIVRSVQVLINGKPQPDWNHVLDSLGLPPHHLSGTGSRFIFSRARFPHSNACTRTRHHSFRPPMVATV